MREDDLIQRFLDHELTPDERVAFLRAVDADPSLRRQWLNLEMVVAEAARLPKIAPSARFISQLKERTRPKPSLWAVLWASATRPRMLNWNLAQAIAAACVVLVAVGALIRLIPERPERIVDTPAPAGSIQTISSEAAEPKVLVRLVFVQPDARSVSVAGDFNGWNPARTTLKRADGGIWTVTLLLKPGRYEYMFVVDGTHWIADPLATEEIGDGFGSRNAVLDVEI
ncbi:MAG: isoamylase early set domain-containing protein [Nitrospira sp.]|nr:isoamylase early set domain-containing protein [Nitrospira sp.]